jgi:hypothetical protein
MGSGGRQGRQGTGKIKGGFGSREWPQLETLEDEWMLSNFFAPERETSAIAMPLTKVRLFLYGATFRFHSHANGELNSD